jgi:hypothetical protein
LNYLTDFSVFASAFTMYETDIGAFSAAVLSTQKENRYGVRRRKEVCLEQAKKRRERERESEREKEREGERQRQRQRETKTERKRGETEEKER